MSDIQNTAAAMPSRRGFVKAAASGAAAVAALGALRAETVKAEEAAGQPAAPVVVNDFFAGKSNARQITDDLWWVGSSDKRIALFENVYPLTQGVAYNSYVLLDEKVVLIDTVDRSVTGEFFENLAAVLDGRQVDYLLINHMEPDHSSAVSLVLSKFPDCQVVTSAMAAAMIQQFFGLDVSDRLVTVAEGDTLTTGAHTLAFVEAPMVHWPEVIVTLDVNTGILFSADAFGTFNALDGNMYADQVNFTADESWLAEARRYFCNIVGKYGPQVQDLLGKASQLDIRMLCSTHGPIWRQDLDWIIDKYDKWSRYVPEENAVAIFYGSIYGGTANAANILASQLSQAGVANVRVYDVSKTHVSWLIAETFRCSHIVLASATYNMGIFTPMKNFLNDLVAHSMRNRCVSFIENGSWSPAAGQLMQDIVATMPTMFQVGDMVTLRSTTSDENVEQLKALATAIAASVLGDESLRAQIEPTGKNAEPAAGTVEAAEKSEGGSRKWQCKVCGYVYEGDELPEDFVCPICGKGPEFFEEVQE